MAEGEEGQARPPVPIAVVVRNLLEDPAYLADLSARVAARTEDPRTLDALVRYARERQVSSGHARVRRLLTDAGVSWEAR